MQDGKVLREEICSSETLSVRVCVEGDSEWGSLSLEEGDKGGVAGGARDLCRSLSLRTPHLGRQRKPSLPEVFPFFQMSLWNNLIMERCIKRIFWLPQIWECYGLDGAQLHVEH